MIDIDEIETENLTKANNEKKVLIIQKSDS